MLYGKNEILLPPSGYSSFSHYKVHHLEIVSLCTSRVYSLFQVSAEHVLRSGGHSYVSVICSHLAFI